MENQTTIHDFCLNTFPEIFTKEQINKIFETIRQRKSRNDVVGEWIKARDLTMIKLCYELGLRPKEVCMLKLNDIDLKAKLVRVSPDGNKLKKGRIVPLPQQVIPVLEHYLSFPRIQFWRFSNFLFPSLKNAHISRDRFSELFRKILKEAGIYKEPTRGTHGHYSLYTLRHTKATEIYRKKKNPFIVADILGHKTLESTKVYIHLNKLSNGYLDELRSAM